MHNCLCLGATHIDLLAEKRHMAFRGAGSNTQVMFLLLSLKQQNSLAEAFQTFSFLCLFLRKDYK